MWVAQNGHLKKRERACVSVCVCVCVGDPISLFYITEEFLERGHQFDLKIGFVTICGFPKVRPTKSLV